MSFSSTIKDSILRDVIAQIFAAIVFFTVTLYANATPVTLEFDATIGPPRQGGGGDFELPFSFAEGNVISGQFTFEPLDVSPDIDETFTVQPFPLELVINGISLTASNYSLRVDDDLTGADKPEPTDEIRLFNGWNEIDGTGGTEFTFQFAFFGEENLLHGADIPSDSATWSRFDFQNNSSVLVTFRDPSPEQFRGFIAFITSVHVVPEPTANFLLMAVLVIIGLFQHRSL